MGKESYETGKYYEEQAALWLKEQGYEILERNFRCSFGEIDIIAVQDLYIVFTEVKYRSGSKWGTPEEAVTKQKQRRISNTALYYMTYCCTGKGRQCRFDVLCTDGKEMILYRNAFDYCGIRSFF